MRPASPAPEGLYDPTYEHDACGVALVATLTGEPSHAIVVQALTALVNLEHRGASGAEVDSGDGAGILVQVPDEFLRGVVDFPLPPAGHYAVGNVFLPGATARRRRSRASRRSPPKRASSCSAGGCCPRRSVWSVRTAASVMPAFRQLYVAAPGAERLRHRARPAGLPAAQARGAGHRRRPLPVAVEPDPGLQGDAHDRAARAVLPRPVGPALRQCAGPGALAGSRPTRSRRGRSRTPIASSPTTARSTPCEATATGCTPVSRSSPPT